jgi:HAD superfamily hydrolase (TIGR01509 family)
MATRGIIFDIDGTLVDTNPTHVEAWRRAFQRLGYEVPTERIEVEIGKGGDQLVPSILSEQASDRDGDALRKAQKEIFLELAGDRSFRVFPGVAQLFDALRQRNVRTALATSSNEKHLQATTRSAGIDLPRLADVLVTSDDAEVSKPAPDLVISAVEELGFAPGECAMVGDTVYDAQASLAAGVTFLGVLSGGSTRETLLEAGASGVWRDTGEMLSDLDRVLEIASLSAVEP